jgi:hypothetical protein
MELILEVVVQVAQVVQAALLGHLVQMELLVLLV